MPQITGFLPSASPRPLIYLWFWAFFNLPASWCKILISQLNRIHKISLLQTRLLYISSDSIVSEHSSFAKNIEKQNKTKQISRKKTRNSKITLKIKFYSYRIRSISSSKFIKNRNKKGQKKKKKQKNKQTNKQTSLLYLKDQSKQ